MNKDELIDIYKTLRRNIGKVPTMREFQRVTRVSNRQVIKKFRTYNELVKAAGDTPRVFSSGQYYTDKEYLDTFGEYIRRFGELPVQSSWEFHGFKPVVRSYTKRFRIHWREMPRLFCAYAENNPAWSDVIAIINQNNLLPFLETKADLPPAFILEPGILDYIPGGLHSFVSLAHNSGSSLEFERKCGEVLGMLGYDVKALGQGKGRSPDGIAEDPLNKCAVIFDAKSRRERYSPGTDDRAIMEYIREWRRSLLGRGFEVIYYLVISSAFSKIPAEWSFRIQSETGAAVSFITAENLLRLLALKIRHPRALDTGRINRVFVRGGVIDQSSIDSV